MLVSAQLEMTLSDGTGGREPAIWTYGGDGDLGELFEGFCDGDGRVGHGGTLALLARLWPGRGRGCMTKGAVTGAAPLNFLTPVPSAIQRGRRPWPGLVDCGGLIIPFGIYTLWDLD